MSKWPPRDEVSEVMKETETVTEEETSSRHFSRAKSKEIRENIIPFYDTGVHF